MPEAFQGEILPDKYQILIQQTDGVKYSVERMACVCVCDFSNV